MASVEVGMEVRKGGMGLETGGRLLVFAAREGLRIVDLKKREVVKEVRVGQGERVLSVAFQVRFSCSCEEGRR